MTSEPRARHVIRHEQVRRDLVVQRTERLGVEGLDHHAPLDPEDPED